jgi:site-specific DNA recombinase
MKNIRVTHGFRRNLLQISSQKKQKVNEGEVPQYYVENSHPAIIEPRAWDEVQRIMRQRKASGKRHDCSSPFSGRVICGDCGTAYGAKVWHSNDPYRKVIWQCNAKFKNKEKCRTPHVTEERLKDGFLEALSILHENRDTLLDDIRLVKHDLENCDELNAKISETTGEMEVVAGLIQKAIEDNATHAQDQDEYNRHYNKLADRYEKLKKRLGTLEEEWDERQHKSEALSGFLFEITEFDYLDAEFKDSRCIAMLDHVTIYADGKMVYSFLNGSDIAVMV